MLFSLTRFRKTGSGKTFTIEGTIQDYGVSPRAVAELFRIVNEGNMSYPCIPRVLSMYFIVFCDNLTIRQLIYRIINIFYQILDYHNFSSYHTSPYKSSHRTLIVQCMSMSMSMKRCLIGRIPSI